MEDDGLEKLMNKLGDFGWYQLFQFTLYMLAPIPTCIHMFSLVTVAAVPDHRCAIDGIDGANYTEPWNSSIVVNAIPVDGQGKLDSCQIYGDNNTLIECESWVYDTQYYTSSRGIEWNFVCSRRWMGALAYTAFMTGVLMGSLILGPLCDKFGRKTIFMFTGVCQIFTGVAVAFTTEYYLFVTMRLIHGFLALSPFKVGYVLTVELIGPSKRAICSAIYQLFWGVGVMLVSFWGYLVDDRFYLQIIYGLHAVILLPHFFLMDESARWLWARGRIQESASIVKKALKFNRSSETVDSALFISNYKGAYYTHYFRNNSTGIFDLFKTPNMRRKTLIILGCYFAIALVYYGLSMNTNVLLGNPYLMLFISGLIEFPAIIVTMYLVNYIGHRAILSSTLLLSGLSLFVVVALPYDSSLTTSAVMFGKLVISGAYTIIYKYGTELFPTVVRTTGVSIGNMCASISAAMTPMIVLLDSFNPKIPTIIFGVLAILFGSLSLILPETQGRKLPETLEDGENFGLSETCFTNCNGRRISDSSISLEETKTLRSKT